MVEGESVSQQPASDLTVSQLVAALLDKPEFRGIVVYDPSHKAEAPLPDLTNFNFRFKTCDPLILCAEMVATFAKIPRGPTPQAPAQETAQTA